MLPGPICGGDTEALRHCYCEQTWDHGEKLKAEQRRGFKIFGEVGDLHLLEKGTASRASPASKYVR